MDKIQELEERIKALEELVYCCLTQNSLDNYYDTTLENCCEEIGKLAGYK